MMTSVKSSVVAAVVGGALALGPAGSPAAAFPSPLGPQSDPRRLSQDERLEQIQKDIARLTELLDGRRDEKGYRLPSDPGVVAKMRALEDKLSELERQVQQLKAGGGSTSLRTPSTGATTPSTRGTVRVVNEYPVRISIVINERNYWIEPNTKLDVDVPPGDFTYQLLQSGATTTRSTIKEREVVTLRVK